jgi:predicted MFS family arabinose efflux permease
VFSAAEVTYLSMALRPNYFRSATGLRMVTNQLAQAVGFAIGGALVAFISPRGALTIDAASYVVSASLISFALKRDRQGRSLRPRRPGPRPIPREPSPWRDQRVRALITLSCLAGFFVVPEGLAVPFGENTGASAAQIGLLIASIPLGGALGAIAFVRWVRPESRSTAANWMAVGCGAPLIVAALVPSWPIALGCWLVSGALAAYQIEIMTSLVYAISDAVRSKFVGIASAGLLGAQGVGVAAFGGIAALTTPGHAIGLAGAVGAAGALAIVLGPFKANAAGAPQHSARPRPHDRAARGRCAESSEAPEVVSAVGARTTSHRGHTTLKGHSPN